MNIQDSNVSYITINDWYIGLYVDGNNLSIYVDSNRGKVTHTSDQIAEDDKQWAIVLTTQATAPMVRTQPTARRRMRVRKIFTTKGEAS